MSPRVSDLDTSSDNSFETKKARRNVKEKLMVSVAAKIEAIAKTKPIQPLARTRSKNLLGVDVPLSAEAFTFCSPRGGSEKSPEDSSISLLALAAGYAVSSELGKTLRSNPCEASWDSALVEKSNTRNRGRRCFMKEGRGINMKTKRVSCVNMEIDVGEVRTEFILN